ncbi:helix-turn-helix domain-containing protein [Sphingomonas sp. 8AM]|uniref:helix-turn-helix domain-containing protein n=1 Tax=Sphingomonas sp. 8AM TaxID=2653170 RepID=UPI0012F1DE02|nr:helix-turn-helix domain-containing protein [Sphingomonas sp. 8AM]VXD00206.1 Transcriptional regulator [Sphingomonas sp. 8AM]
MVSLVRSPKSLGEALRRARRAAGLTQAELGRRTSLRQATISSLENGDGATLDTLFAVLTALRLDVELGPRSDSGPALEDLF